MKNIRKSLITCALFFSMVCVYFLLGDGMIANAADADAVDDACKGVVRVMGLYEYSNGTIYGYATGSGFGVGDAGEETDTFVTNWHVVTNTDTNEQLKDIYILLNDDAVVTDDSGMTTLNYENMIKCEVSYTTTGYPDIAILKTEEKVEGRTALPLMKSENAKRAQTIYALGYPGTADGLNNGKYLYASVKQVTATDGKISKFTTIESTDNTDVIQHTAHLNHGNSGGPLINEDGVVIGINTYSYDASDTETNNAEYNLSIYSNYAMDALDELGISYDTVTSSDSKTSDTSEDTEDTEDTEESEDSSDSEGGVSGILFYLGILIGALILVLFIVILIKVVKGSKKKETYSAPMASSEPIYTPPIQRTPVPVSQVQAAEIPQQHLKEADILRICGVSGEYGGKRFRVDSKMHFGREAGAHEVRYSQNAKGISRKHCELFEQGGYLYLIDHGSQYGTFYNGRRLAPEQPVRISVGDTFYLASEDNMFYVDKSSHLK